jgi:hypothetical protein
MCEENAEYTVLSNLRELKGEAIKKAEMAETPRKKNFLSPIEKDDFF